MNRHVRLLTASLLLTIVASACSSDPSSPGTTFTFIKANVGSSFTFDVFETDSLGMMVPGTRDTIVHNVVAAGLTYGGKSNVIMVTERARSGEDTTYYAYETNNDISLTSGPDTLGTFVWSTFPVASGTPQPFTSVDTVDFLGIITIVRTDILTTRDGEASLSIDGVATPTVRININTKLGVTLAGLPAGIIESNSYINYAPSIGYLVKVSTQGQEDQNGDWQNGGEHTLIRYVLT